MKYSAFLSYSHRDNRRDGNRWADWLQRELEEFKVPPELVNRPGRYGEPVPDRLFPVFQDEKELPTEADLGQAIREALADSRYLVVICSPNAARSRYVNEEVLEFKRLGRANRILALIVAGEPNASDPRKQMDAALECFPEALRHPLDDRGQLDLTRVSEPIAADVRSDDGSEVRLEDKRHRARLDREKLRIAAGLLGVGFDTLVNRDRERALADAQARASRFRKLAATFAVLALAAVGAGVLATVERNTADVQRKAAVRALSKSDLVQALHLISQRDDSSAVAYLVRGLKNDPANAAAATRLSSLLISRRWLSAVATIKHGSAIRSAYFSPDGTQIVTASEDHTARVWNAETGAPITAPLMHADNVRMARFSPDGTRIVTASRDGMVRIWNAATGQPLTAPLKRGEYQINDVEFSPDGAKIVAAASLPYVADVLDAATGRVLFSIKHGESLFEGRFTPDGRRILTLSSKRLQVSDARTGAPAGAAITSESDLTSANVSPDGTRIVATYWNGDVRMWDASSGRQIGETMKHARQAVWAEFSPDGLRIVSASWDRTARVWDAASGRPVTPPMAHGGALSYARFSPDGKSIVTSATDFGAIGYNGGAQEPMGRVWDATTGEPMTPLLNYGKPVWDAEFNPAGTRLLTISPDSTVSVWDATTNVAIAVSARHDGVVSSVAFSPDGTRIASSSIDKTARVWDASSGKQVAAAQHDGPVIFVVFDPSGARLLTGSSTARVWSADTGQPIGAAMPRTDPSNDPIGFFAGAFSPDGQRVVTASTDRTARVWDAATGRPLTEPLRHEREVGVARFNADGTRVLTADSEAAHLWDARTGRPIWATVPDKDRIEDAAFNADSTRIVTISGARAHVWDAATGKLLVTTLPHESDAYLGVFSPDSRRIATASKDKTARMWDALTGQPALDPLRHDDMVTAVQFSSDGLRLLTASSDGMARIWDVETGQPLADPFKAPEKVDRSMPVKFNRDGTRVVAAAGAAVHVWDVAPNGPPPPWFLDLAGALAGRVLDDQGVLRPPARDPVLILDDVRKRLAVLPADPWVSWGRWLLAQPATRPVSPLAASTR